MSSLTTDLTVYAYILLFFVVLYCLVVSVDVSAVDRGILTVVAGSLWLFLSYARFASHWTASSSASVQSGQTDIQLNHRAWIENVRHRLGLGHRSTGPSLLDAKSSFYWCHSGLVQYGNDSAETTIVDVRLSDRGVSHYMAVYYFVSD